MARSFGQTRFPQHRAGRRAWVQQWPWIKLETSMLQVGWVSPVLGLTMQPSNIHCHPTGIEKKRLAVFSGPATRQVNEKPKTSNRVQVQYCPSALQPYSQPLGAQVGS